MVGIAAGLVAVPSVVTSLVMSIPPAQPPANTTLVVFSGYMVRPGDTLSAISVRFCGTRSDYPSIAAASGIRNPDVIVPGERIVIKCKSDGSSSIERTTAGISYSFSGLEALWRGAGGAPSAAPTAACIAEHESGGVTRTIGATSDWGLWQIHNGGFAMLNPFTNAARAVFMSSNGRDWSPWTTHRSCGV